MSENYSNMLMIRNEPEPGTMAVIPIVEPRNELLIRYEPDTRRIFIASGPFKKWCSKQQVSYNSLVASLNQLGVTTELVKKRMAKGTALIMPPTSTLMLHVPDNLSGSIFGLDEMDKLDEKKAQAVSEALT
jgi:hypothetical protein